MAPCGKAAIRASVGIDIISNSMKLALFDLDNTLLAGDSDLLWTEFLIDEGILSQADKARSDRFYRDYAQGTLDIQGFLDFQLRPLRDHPPEQLQAWRSRFMETKILPVITPAARQLVAGHRQQGHRTVIITATNRFTTTPIASELGVEALLATELEQIDGRYTGRLLGQPCFKEGKIDHLRRWIDTQDRAPQESWFYSDSANDIPLLEWVDHPFAVDPDPRLHGIATTRGWPIITLR